MYKGTYCNIWRYKKWSDSDLGISSSNRYTVAVNFGGSAATINGVNFIASALTGTNFTIAGTVTVAAGENLMTNALAQNYIYKGDPRTITLKNLIIGRTYETNLFSVAFEAPPFRDLVFTSGIDSLSLDQDYYGDKNGILFTYTFRATSTTKIITITPVNPTYTLHLYALTNNIAKAVKCLDLMPSSEPSSVPSSSRPTGFK